MLGWLSSRIGAATLLCLVMAALLIVQKEFFVRYSCLGFASMRDSYKRVWMHALSTCRRRLDSNLQRQARFSNTTFGVDYIAFGRPLLHLLSAREVELPMNEG